MRPLGVLNLFSQLLIRGVSSHNTEVSRLWKVMVYVVVLFVCYLICFCGSGDSLYVTALFSVLLLSFLLQITMTY